MCFTSNFRIVLRNLGQLICSLLLLSCSRDFKRFLGLVIVLKWSSLTVDVPLVKPAAAPSPAAVEQLAGDGIATGGVTNGSFSRRNWFTVKILGVGTSFIISFCPNMMEFPLYVCTHLVPSEKILILEMQR